MLSKYDKFELFDFKNKGNYIVQDTYKQEAILN